MSLIHFSNAVERAKVEKEEHKSLLEPAAIIVSCDTLIFAYEHIHLLEEQLAKAQNDLVLAKQSRENWRRLAMLD